MNEKEFAEWLEEEMDRQNLTRKELANRAGITVTTLRYYLREMRSPSLRCVNLVLGALGKKLVIVDDEDPRSDEK